MHDGRFASLEEVIHFYNTLEGASAVGHHGEMVLEPLGLDAAGEADLVAFLQSISASLAKSEWMLDPLITPVRNEGIADQ
jgi:cytochrome c peroxidase